MLREDQERNREKAWHETYSRGAGLPSGAIEACDSLVPGAKNCRGKISTVSAAKRIPSSAGDSMFKVIHLFSLNSVCYA